MRTVSLADTVGTATPEHVGELFDAIKNCVAGVELGVHLHSRREGAAEKVLAAYEAGCRRFDGALTGLGGCPFAGDELVGNIPTEIVIETLAALGVETGISLGELVPALDMAMKLRREFAYAREPCNEFRNSHARARIRARDDHSQPSRKAQRNFHADDRGIARRAR